MDMGQIMDTRLSAETGPPHSISYTLPEQERRVPLSAVIVDDEQLARDELAYLLKNIGDVDVVARVGPFALIRAEVGEWLGKSGNLNHFEASRFIKRHHVLVAKQPCFRSALLGDPALHGDHQL